MSTLTRTPRRVDLLHPVVAATAGAATYCLTLTLGEVLDLNAEGASVPAPSWKEILLYLGVALTATFVASWLGLRGRAGSPSRLAATALSMAIAAAVLSVAFWSGWPQTFGAVASALAMEHRRRVGSFSPTTTAALALGAVAFVASVTACVIG